MREKWLGVSGTCEVTGPVGPVLSTYRLSGLGTSTLDTMRTESNRQLVNSTALENHLGREVLSLYLENRKESFWLAPEGHK